MDKLAQELGISVEQLREFLVNGGGSQIVNSYAKSIALQDICLGLLGLVILIAVAIHFHKKYETGVLNHRDDFGVTLSLMVLSITTVVFLSKGIAWLLYPQGCILRLISSKF